MARFTRLVVILGISFLLSAGCPSPVPGASPSGGNGTSPTTPASAGVNAGNSTGVGQTHGGSDGSATTGGASPVSGSPACGKPGNGVEWCDEVLSLVNNERTSRGLGALVLNGKLTDEADEYACELIQYDFFAHENPVTGSTLRDRAENVGYNYWVIGENLAAGQASPGEVMQDWMASEGHRENILEPRFTEIGIAVRTGGEYGTYWVQEFGQPQ